MDVSHISRRYKIRSWAARSDIRPEQLLFKHINDKSTCLYDKYTPIWTYFTALFKMIKHLVKGLFEVIFEDTVHQLVEPCAIFVIHQAVIVDTEDFVDKQADHSAFVLQRLFLQQQTALDNT